MRNAYSPTVNVRPIWKGRGVGPGADGRVRRMPCVTRVTFPTRRKGRWQGQGAHVFLSARAKVRQTGV